MAALSQVITDPPYTGNSIEDGASDYCFPMIPLVDNETTRDSLQYVYYNDSLVFVYYPIQSSPK